MYWHIQVRGALLILKTQNYHCVWNESLSLVNIVGFKIIQSDLYLYFFILIFISSRPLRKNPVRSRLEGCRSGRCKGQTDVLLSAIQVYGPQMDSGWKKARTYSTVWVLWQGTHVGNRWRALLLLTGRRAMYLFLGSYRITESQNVRGWKGPLWVI